MTMPSSGVALTADADAPPVATGHGVWRRLGRDPAFWVGAVAVVGILTAAVGADVLWPRDPNFGVRQAGLDHPSGITAEFPLGTDRLGRDYLSRLLHGGRTSLTVGVSANLVASILGAAVGATAAFIGTVSMESRFARRTIRLQLPVETLLMRLTDVFLSLPALLVAIALVAVLGPSLPLVTFVIAGVLWTTTARVVYTRTRVLRGMDYVLAARALGASEPDILLRHVAPHLVPLVVVYATLGIAAAILFEAVLSFLGVGVPLPAASWGTMISEHVSYFRTDPRLLLLPGMAITLTVLAFNLLGDALHDALDPHAQRG